jgi:hypothetical protein
LLDRQAEPDRAAPVLHDDREVVQVELLHQPDDRAEVEVVGVVLLAQRLVGAPEAEVVRGDRPRARHELGKHLPVEVGPRRLAVQEQHGRAVALVQEVHPEALLLDVVGREGVSRQGVEALVGRAVGVQGYFFCFGGSYRKM